MPQIEIGFEVTVRFTPQEFAIVSATLSGTLPPDMIAAATALNVKLLTEKRKFLRKLMNDTSGALQRAESGETGMPADDAADDQVSSGQAPVTTAQAVRQILPNAQRPGGAIRTGDQPLTAASPRFSQPALNPFDLEREAAGPPANETGATFG